MLEAVSQYVQGREELVRLLTIALLAGGHVLVEGLPGTAKTLSTRCFAQAIGGEFRRIQLTPDDVLRQYLGTVRPMHKRFVAPSASRAELVLDGEGVLEVELARLLEAIQGQR